MTQKQLKEERKLLYYSNQDKYNKAVVVTYGVLLALIDYIEESNEVFPELITTSLKNEVNKVLNAVYKNGVTDEVMNEHNQVAELFRTVVKENIK